MRKTTCVYRILGLREYSQEENDTNPENDVTPENLIASHSPGLSEPPRGDNGEVAPGRPFSISEALSTSFQNYKFKINVEVWNSIRSKNPVGACGKLCSINATCHQCNHCSSHRTWGNLPFKCLTLKRNKHEKKEARRHHELQNVFLLSRVM